MTAAEYKGTAVCTLLDRFCELGPALNVDEMKITISPRFAGKIIAELKDALSIDVRRHGKLRFLCYDKGGRELFFFDVDPNLPRDSFVIRILKP